MLTNMLPKRLNNVVGLETYRLSRAEQTILDILDGECLHDMDESWDLAYIEGLREHTRYDIDRGAWVGISSYPQWLSSLSLNPDQ